MIVSAARIVTPSAVLEPGSLVIHGDRISAIEPARRSADYAYDAHAIVPGFVDVHVHGVDGADALGSPDGVLRMATALPKYGVAAFCPTSIACAPAELRAMLAAVSRLRRDRPPGTARVLRAHLESNFINADYCGAQPRGCLRFPPPVYVEQGIETARTHHRTTAATPSNDDFDGHDVLREIEAAPDAVGIVTLAPELPGALDLIRSLTAAGYRVSIGHSAATFDEGLAGVDAGARHATHLFNRMPPFSHRAPGLVGAVFEREEVTAELIADGHHVHPATARVAIRALGVHRTLAITDGTALAGLPSGSVATIGFRRITAGTDVARLEDGTWAGSVLTMDQAFRNVVERFGLGLVEAALLCSTNPARAAGASELGMLAPGSAACFAVLDAELRVVQTFVDGVPVLPQ